MKLFLFGGAETDQGQAPRLKQLIREVLEDIKPEQALHVPYARLQVPEGEELVWGDGWVKRDLVIEGMEWLDARNEKDLARAHKPVVFINGGYQRELLYQKIIANQRLYHLVLEAEYYIGESAGSMVCGEYQRFFSGDEMTVSEGLGILQDTVIEGHYTERNRQAWLREQLQLSGAAYGVGIDSLTALVVDPDSFPEEFSTLGDGAVEILKN